ncbi:forkhead box protein J1-B-like [Lineus longissimus]|uniref:forkhead box protein J1-B-like n=1 Tax=Lineus longissimus TaxID=88925 RepID=UPI002B4F85F0
MLILTGKSIRRNSPAMKMPILTRDHLAVKLRQNWVAKHGHEAGAPPAPSAGAPNLDDSLTSLNWLQNLNIMKITTPTPPPSPQPMLLESAKGDMKVNPNSVLNMTNIHPPRIDFHKGHLADIAPTTASTLDKIDYKTNPYIKPPYSYATLICMAMKETKKSKITLSAIYNWITENFMYYRMADPSWQNSIRHNLSLNKCFQKVPRRKDEPGKGGFWRINPEYSDMFVNGIFKKRRTSTRENIQPMIKKIKREPDDDSSSNSSLCSFSALQRPIKIKTELDLSDTRRYRSMLTGEELNNSDILRGDFSWNSLLNQDIDVAGVKIKTEDIINGTDEVVIDQGPMVGLSPPPSEGNSDSGLDDFWGMDFTESAEMSNDAPLDLSTNAGCCDPLDLTIQGVGLRPPEGWSESFNGYFSTAKRSPSQSSGLHTPIAPSPIHDGCSDIDFSHPWAESRLDLDEAIAAFDVDNLFDVDNIPSPRV